MRRKTHSFNSSFRWRCCLLPSNDSLPRQARDKEKGQVVIRKLKTRALQVLHGLASDAVALVRKRKSYCWVQLHRNPLSLSRQASDERHREIKLNVDACHVAGTEAAPRHAGAHRWELCGAFLSPTEKRLALFRADVFSMGKPDHLPRQAPDKRNNQSIIGLASRN